MGVPNLPDQDAPSLHTSLAAAPRIFFSPAALGLQPTVTSPKELHKGFEEAHKCPPVTQNRTVCHSPSETDTNLQTPRPAAELKSVAVHPPASKQTSAFSIPLGQFLPTIRAILRQCGHRRTQSSSSLRPLLFSPGWDNWQTTAWK